MATLSTDFWGIYLTLTEAETKELVTTDKLALEVSAIVSGLAGLLKLVPVTAVAAVLTLYLKIEMDLVSAVDAGNGVVLNLPWIAIWAGQYWLIYPTPVSLRIQQNWRWCSRCDGLYWVGDASATTGGICPGGGSHGPNTSGHYRLVMDVPTYQGQHDWRHCDKCSGLFWAGGQENAGHCPAGGSHSRGVSSDYALVMNDPSFSGQNGWRFCGKCSGLYWVGDASATTGGICPAGGGHVLAGTTDYALMN